MILPILIPLNYVNGRGSYITGSASSGYSNTSVTGLDRLAWGNVPPNKNNRYWAHLVLAIGVVIYTCFVFFDELRGYIRLRQAYLTSPQHRLRASATTVLVTAIPPKWCTFEALDGLYDVFPGGVRNIWINRNFDELNSKIKWRDKLARSLESAETSLIKSAKKAQLKRLNVEAKKASGKTSKADVIEQLKVANNQGLAMAQTDGISSGDPHQVRHTIDEALADSSNEQSIQNSPSRKRHLVPIPVLGQGVEAVGHGMGNIGKTVLGGFKSAGKGIDERLHTTGRFIPAPPEPAASRTDPRMNRINHFVDGSRSRSVSPDTVYHQEAKDRQHNHRELSNDSSLWQTSSQGGGESRSGSCQDRQGLGINGAPVGLNSSRNSATSDILNNPHRLGEAHQPSTSMFKFWRRGKNVPYGIPSPTPHGREEDEFPLSRPSPMTPGCNPQATINGPGSYASAREAKLPTKKSEKRTPKDKAGNLKAVGYPVAYSEDYDHNMGKPAWRAYLKEKDRDSMRLPIFGWQWMISLPLLGKKVDTINYCRKEVARLNAEIEQDQKEPDRFPLMNSAFVQFNHQVAAHMACQAVSHHTPNQMAPRVVEISPDDVIWDNMSIKWWEAYIRTVGVLVIIAGLIIGWAFPVTITGLLSQVKYLEDTFSWLHWLTKAPNFVISIIQGVLPPALLGLLLLLLPVILRFLARSQGNHTGMAVELSLQKYYFTFLFVQVFLVVSISSGITTVVQQISESPQSVPSILAQNLPKASNYFFSYLLLQALSVSAGALVQVMGLFKWFLLAPLLDSTARQKWHRQTDLPNMRWGTFFPVYTNLASIGE